MTPATDEMRVTLHKSMVEMMRNVFGEDTQLDFVLVIPSEGFMVTTLNPGTVAVALVNVASAILSDNLVTRLSTEEDESGNIVVDKAGMN